jgi:hypothetical protein
MSKCESCKGMSRVLWMELNYFHEISNYIHKNTNSRAQNNVGSQVRLLLPRPIS